MIINPNTQETPSCSICLDDLHSNCKTTSCANKPISHIFHRDCANDWAKQFTSSQNVTCPDCRNYPLANIVGSKAEQHLSQYQLALRDPLTPPPHPSLNPPVLAQPAVAGFDFPRFTNLQRRRAMADAIEDANQRVAVRSDIHRVGSAMLAFGGISLGISFAGVLLKLAVITGIAIGAFGTMKKESAEDLSPPTWLITAFAGVGMAALVADLVTERKLFKEVDVVARGVLGGCTIVAVGTATAVITSAILMSVVTLGKRASTL